MVTYLLYFLEFIFINDETQEVERFFAGDYDTYMVGRAQWWSQRFVADEFPEIERGLIQRKKYIKPSRSFINEFNEYVKTLRNLSF